MASGAAQPHRHHPKPRTLARAHEVALLLLLLLRGVPRAERRSLRVHLHHVPHEAGRHRHLLAPQAAAPERRLEPWGAGRASAAPPGLQPPAAPAAPPARESAARARGMPGAVVRPPRSPSGPGRMAGVKKRATGAGRLAGTSQGSRCSAAGAASCSEPARRWTRPRSSASWPPLSMLRRGGAAAAVRGQSWRGKRAGLVGRPGCAHGPPGHVVPAEGARRPASPRLAAPRLLRGLTLNKCRTLRPGAFDPSSLGGVGTEPEASDEQDELVHRPSRVGIKVILQRHCSLSTGEGGKFLVYFS